MPKKISKDTPLLELTLRKYEKPYSTSKRDSIRKLCLSIGLLQPGDSRDIVVDILQVLLNNRKRKVFMNSEEIRNRVITNRKKAKLSTSGAAASNVRRQLKRLRDIFLVEIYKNKYAISEFLPLKDIFEEKIEKFFISSIKNRIKEYLEKVEE
jgi:hypothetical protein